MIFPIHHKSGLFLPIHLHRPHIKLKRITVKTLVQESLYFFYFVFFNAVIADLKRDERILSELIRYNPILDYNTITKIRVEQVELICS